MNGAPRGYLNEVSPLTQRSASGERRDAGSVDAPVQRFRAEGEVGVRGDNEICRTGRSS
jgi:hypothetical protein